MASSGVKDYQENNDAGGDESDEFSEEFMCCVCLDLVYKPVVLACGHISCFWCVFEAMGYSWQESLCPVCRHSYNHFPSICRQLHFVLLKLYPLAYKRRERQVVEEEKKLGTFSPQFNGYLCESYSSKEVSGTALQSIPDSLEKLPLESYSVKEGEFSLVQDSSQVVLSDKDITTTNPVSLSSEVTRNAVQESNKFGGKHGDGTCKQAFITDILCARCKQLLYRPVVLNCGHVFCEGCIINSSNKLCRCPECQSMHPNGFPKVCLVIEHFLEEHVSEEYAARRAAVGKLHKGSIQAQQDDANCSSLPTNYQLFDQGQKVHFGVGCDCCGFLLGSLACFMISLHKERNIARPKMYPISGERYKCKDCVEEIGFDLCEGCYKSSSKLAGRFNQQHRPEHKFENLEPPFILNAGIIEEHVPLSPEEPMDEFPISGPSRGAQSQSDSEPDLPAPNSSNETEEAREASPLNHYDKISEYPS